MKKAFQYLTLLTLLTGNIASAINAQTPLRRLVMESELIVFGHVLETYDNPIPKEDLDKSIARIAVLEILQGEMCDDTIMVPFNPVFACPANPNYVDNTFVIGFLDKLDDSYTTHALYFGAKTLTKDEVEIYKARIYELQEILNHTSQRWQFIELVEWLVKCAEEKTTRWEGTYELTADSDFMKYYASEVPADFGDLLTGNQKARLKRELLNSTEIGRQEFVLADLVHDGNETEIEDFLISRFKMLPENQYGRAWYFIPRLQHRNTSQEMEKVLADYYKMLDGYFESWQLKVIIDRFIALVE